MLDAKFRENRLTGLEFDFFKEIGYSQMDSLVFTIMPKI